MPEEEEVNENPHNFDYDAPLPETDNKRWELDEEPIIAALYIELSKRLNNRGVADVIGWIRIALNKTSALTNLDMDEIRTRVVSDIRAFNDELRQNNRLWGIKNAASRTAISRWVEKSYYDQVKRAFQDGERKYRKDSYGYNENYSHDEVRADEIGSGFRMPNLNPFKKKRTNHNENDYQGGGF